jgi:glycosyltransferase involved in cell wall biosynthesis
MQIHQILPSISYGDAVSNHVVEIREILKEMNYDSEIYAENIHPKMLKLAKPISEYKSVSSPSNVVLFHMAIGSDVSYFVKSLPDKKVLIYHNITPHSYFLEYNDGLVNLTQRGRQELKLFKDCVDLALGVSEYNRRELEEAGFKNTDVLSIIVDFDKYNQVTNRTLHKYEENSVNLLFVGRYVPNKKIEDIIKIFYYYKTYLNSNSNLFIVGSYNGMEKYYSNLKNMVRELNLDDVHFTGHVEFADLIHYYRLADIFLCMSEHEGFCVPLLESMYFEIPIISFNSTAIPYTLGNAGILVNKKNYLEIAEMIDVVINDSELKAKVIKKQQERLSHFDKDKISEKFKRIIEDLLS